MKGKLTLLWAFALIFAYSPAFAEESAAKGAEQHHQEKMDKKAGENPEQKKTVKPAAKAKAEKPVLRKVTKEEEGKEEICPATGEKFKVTAKTPSVTYKDKVYYFCCPGCDKSFIANPEKYLNKKPAAQAKKYVCPMGEFEGDKPGKCPKCGMNLVEKKQP